MIDLIPWIHALILDYPALKYMIIFVGIALGGEPVLFLVGFIMAQGMVSILPTVVVTFFGTFIPNALWFFLGRTALIRRITSYRYTATTVSVVVEAVEHASRGSRLIALIIIKFLVGTPVLLVAYISKIKLSVKEFIHYQSVAIVLSMIVIMSAGYLGGRGFLYLTEIFQSVYTAIGFILFILLALVALQIWFERRFTGGA